MYKMGSGMRELIAGSGRFVDDVIPDGTLHAAFVRSTLAHAILEGFDLPRPGGDALVHTAGTLGAPDIPVQLRPNAPAVVMDRPTLVKDRVRYMGEPLAMALAPSPERAADVADEVWADLSPLPGLVDPVMSARDEMLLFPEAGTNIAHRTERGLGDAPLPDAPVIVEVEVANRRLAAVAIEPLACLAIPRRDHVEIWCGSQMPHRLRRQMSLVFGRPESFFRIIVPDVGGGFGLKGPLYPEYVAVVSAALLHDRPILWRERRREAFSGGVHGRGLRHRIRLAGDRDGQLIAIRFEIIGDLGAYPHYGFVPIDNAVSIAAGPYQIGDLGVVGLGVVTNLAPMGPYRGAGRPEAALAMERAIEVFSRRIGRDAVEVRMRNMIRPDDLPMHTATGARYDSGDYRRALQVACERLDVSSVRKRQKARLEQGDNPIGIGVASFVEPAGGAPESGEYVSVEVDAQGTVIVKTGSTSTGQRHGEVWGKVVSQVFDLHPEKVRVVSGDTAEVSDGEGTYGSRSTQISASGLKACAELVVERARRLAAEIIEASPEDLSIRDGKFSVVGSPGSLVTLAQVAALAEEKGEPLKEEEFHRLGHQTFSYGTHAAEVEVDLDTGEVRVRRLIAVDDAGLILDRAAAEGQVRGGIAQGLGQALFEAIEYDSDCQLITGSLMSYSIPHASDIPPTDLVELETPSPMGLGAKGVGESGVIGVPAAILNATLDALRPFGVEELSLPLTPEAVWSGLRRASGAHDHEQTT